MPARTTESSKSQAIAQRLGYEADTAGRIMTLELISLKQNFTVSQALKRIRNLANASEMIYYLYTYCDWGLPPLQQFRSGGE